MTEPLLHIDAIDAFYGDFQALASVSLRVEVGQVVAVIGANGAGKSTLMRCIQAAGRSASRARRSAACRHSRWSGWALRWCRKGAGCFRP